MAVRHIVLFSWNSDVDQAHIDGFSAALAQLPIKIPEIREYQFGPDLALVDSNYHYGVTATFDDEAGYRVYREHPAHLAVIAEFSVGRVDRRAAVQIHVDD
jgi:hypothetical protein